MRESSLGSALSMPLRLLGCLKHSGRLKVRGFFGPEGSLSAGNKSCFPSQTNSLIFTRKNWHCLVNWSLMQTVHPSWLPLITSFVRITTSSWHLMEATWIMPFRDKGQPHDTRST